MAAKREQLRAWLGARSGLASRDLGVRMRSTVFALLGLATAACLAVVAIFAYQGAPFLPSLPLPGMSAEDEHVAAAEPVAVPHSVIAAAGDRLASAAETAGTGAAPSHRGRARATEAPAVVPPGPSSALEPPSSDGPVASPVPVSEPPPDNGGGSAPESTPDSPPASAPPASSTSSPSDAQLASSKSSKGNSGKRNSSSGRGESGTDSAVATSTKKGPPPAPAPEVPQMTDAEPEPASDADLDDSKGNGHRK